MPKFAEYLTAYSANLGIQNYKTKYEYLSEETQADSEFILYYLEIKHG